MWVFACMYALPKEARRGRWIPWKRRLLAPYGCWESNPRPRQQLFTAEPTLHFKNKILKMKAALGRKPWLGKAEVGPDPILSIKFKPGSQGVHWWGLSRESGEAGAGRLLSTASQPVGYDPSENRLQKYLHACRGWPTPLTPALGREAEASKSLEF